jgi:DnaJ like chaperone protein
MDRESLILLAVVVLGLVVGYWMMSVIITQIKSSNQYTSRKRTKQNQPPHSEDGGVNETKEIRETNIIESISKHSSWNHAKGIQSNLEDRYAKTLGLSGKITGSDVRRAYRKMIAKYHPDKVSHLGDEIKEVSELKTSEIIEAYEYFRKKFNFK